VYSLRNGSSLILLKYVTVEFGLIEYFLDKAVVRFTKAFNEASVGILTLKFPIKEIPTVGVLFQLT
jgi:hypothetical protein